MLRNKSTNILSEKQQQIEGSNNVQIWSKTGLCKSTSRYCTWVTRNRWFLWDLFIEKLSIMLAKIKNFEVPLCIACAGAHYTVGGHNCPWASELVLMCPSKKRKRKKNKKFNKPIKSNFLIRNKKSEMESRLSWCTHLD